MQDWEMSEERQYASYVFQRLSIVAYLCSIVIFTASMALFNGVDRESLNVAAVLFIGGAAFAVMDGIIICDVPVCCIRKEESLDEKEKDKIRKLMSELETIDQEEDKK